MSTSAILALADQCLLKNVNRIPLSFVKGEGLKLWDPEGRVYWDFIGGIAVCAFGHAPPFMAEVLHKQAQELVHVSNLFYNEPMVRLAAKLTEASGLARAFFANSGAEANETAFKMARKYGKDKYGEGRYKIVSAHNSFHGRTLGAVSLTGQPSVQAGFAPLVPGTLFVPFGDIKALDEALDETVAGVILEPIQGEGGVTLPPEGYFPRVKALCQERGALLIFDEVQTGLGRTGTDFAFRHFGATPDIMTLGKALGSGYPVGACLATEEAAAALGPGTHSTTVGGAPLGMAVALELVARILEPAFLQRVASVGDYFKKGLLTLPKSYPALVEGVRGLGLLLGLNLKIPAAPLTVLLRERGFLVNATAGTVLRFVPPLTVTEKEIDLLLEALSAVLASQ
jgi:predicted acetylornithine/succinylornithine family transaminase